MRSRLLVLGLATALAAGCASVPPTHFYSLALPDIDQPAAESSAGFDIAVRPFRIDPPYDQDRIVYRPSATSTKVGFYEYHRWATPLTRSLAHITAQALSSAIGIRTIEPVVPRRGYDAYLDGRLLVLDEIDGVDGQLVRLSLELSIWSIEGDEIWWTRIDRQATMRTDNVEQIVRQMSALLADGLAEARKDLEAVLAEELEAEADKSASRRLLTSRTDSTQTA